MLKQDIQMGIMRSNKIEWSEVEIQDKLRRNFMSESNIKYVAENLFIYEWESDLWFLTKSNITYEIEIKITKADFKNDFKKVDKHAILTEEKKLDKKGRPCLLPNYFYYAVPEKMIEESDVPSYAGLIYMKDYFPYFEIIKPAPSLTKRKPTEEELNLTEKFYYNYRDWKLKTRVERSQADELNNLIDKFQEKPEGEKKTYVKLLEENKKFKEGIDYWKECYDRYYKAYQDSIKESDLKRHMIRELRHLLDKHHIEYDYEQMENDYLEKYKEWIN